MAVPVVAARAAIARLVDDLEAWIVRFAILAHCLVALPASAAAVGFGGLLAIFGNVAPHAAAPALPRQTAEGLAAVTPAVVRIGASGGRLIDGWTNPAALNQSTELTTAGALTVARQYRPRYKAPPPSPRTCWWPDATGSMSPTLLRCPGRTTPLICLSLRHHMH